MGYNQNCDYQTCTSNCCNQFGSCPQNYPSFYGSYYTDCYYYYESESQIAKREMLKSPGFIMGIAFGSFFLCICIVIGIVCCIRRRSMNNKNNMNQQTLDTSTGQQIIVNSNPNGVPNYNSQSLWAPQGYAQPVNNYAQPQYLQQPEYVQPVVLNGYQNQGVYSQPMGYPQQQGPIFQRL